MTEKSSTTLPGTVEEIIHSTSDQPEKAQIAVGNPDEARPEIRIDNVLTMKNGDEVSLKKGSEVKITIES